MIARLEEANKSSTPILLRTSSSAGHGIGTAPFKRFGGWAYSIFLILIGAVGTELVQWIYKLLPHP